MESQRVVFGEYLPDLPSSVNPGLTVALNTVTTRLGTQGSTA